jgi:hypothetical protein
MGVSESQFWEMNPRLLAPFVRAEQIRLERQNQIAWMTGGYIQRAIAASFSRSAEYPEKPIRITPMTEREKEEEAEYERRKAIEFFRKMEENFKRKEAMSRGRGTD